MRTMIMLDVFCAGGGSATGLHQACPDARIIGIDKEPQPDYPFEFIQADYTEAKCIKADFAWASPPCQRYSRGGNPTSRERYPDLVAPTREMLLRMKVPFVIENVMGAPLRKDLMLCGEMFKLGVFRHRIFEINGFECRQPIHPKHIGTVSDGDKIMVCRGGGASRLLRQQRKESKAQSPHARTGQQGNGNNPHNELRYDSRGNTSSLFKVYNGRVSKD